MPMRKYKPEQIVTLLRQVEVELANGKTTPQACKEAEITAQTYYRWYKKPRSRRLNELKALSAKTGAAVPDAPAARDNAARGANRETSQHPTL
jgi:hypothetical protein